TRSNKSPNTICIIKLKDNVDIRTLNLLVNTRLHKKWFAEAEIVKESDGGIRHGRSIDGFARAGFTRVGEMGFVKHGVGKRAEPVGVHGLDMLGALDSVGRSAVRRTVECVVRVLG